MCPCIWARKTFFKEMIDMAQDLTQWEYRDSSYTDMNELNERGNEGWEAVGVDSANKHVLLKRPKQPQQPSRPRDDDRYYGR